MRVKEWQGDVVFLHEVGEGAADRSYGVHVARLAGLPDPVLARAEEVLHGLEQGEARSAPARLAEDLPLFAAVVERARPRPARREIPAIERALEAVDPDALTARDALQLVYRLKALLHDRSDADDRTEAGGT
jgi:DNA mismatch repair protein MutS